MIEISSEKAGKSASPSELLIATVDNYNSSTGSTLIITPMMLITYKPMELWQLGCLLGAGVCAALAQFSITAAYTCAPPKEISVYDFTQVIFTSVISICVFSTLPDIYSVIGYVIIVSMAVVNYFLGFRKSHSG